MGTRPLTQVVSKSITAGEALLAATLGITLHNRIEWKNAWTMVRGTLVCREGGGNEGGIMVRSGLGGTVHCDNVG